MSLVVKSVKEAPWKVGDVGVLQDLEAGLGQWLLDECTKFNNISQKKKPESDKQ